MLLYCTFITIIDHINIVIIRGFLQVLFDRRKNEWGVKRSATFHDRGDDESEDDYDEQSDIGDAQSRGNNRKSMHRSSTMPIEDGAIEGPLGAIGSTFKLPFA